MTTSTLISRLEGVKQTGPGRWLAKCPAHDDRSPSLAIREVEDGRLLIHCFTGCATPDVLAAVGLGLADLFPEGPRAHHAPPERRPFPAFDVLKAIVFEVTIVSLFASKLLRGEAFTEDDYARIRLAADRLDEAVALAGGAS